MSYLSIRYTERLLEAGIESSVGSVGDSYDNALAETIIGLFKSEIIRRRGPWRNVEHVELAGRGPHGDDLAQSFQQSFQMRHALSEFTDLTTQVVDVLPQPASGGKDHSRERDAHSQNGN